MNRLEANVAIKTIDGVVEQVGRNVIYMPKIVYKAGHQVGIKWYADKYKEGVEKNEGYNDK